MYSGSSSERNELVLATTETGQLSSGSNVNITASGDGHLLSFTTIPGERSIVQFGNLSGTLTINGTAYTLVNSVASLASAIAANPSGAFALAKSYNAKGDGTYAASPIATQNFWNWRSLPVATIRWPSAAGNTW